MPGDVVVTGTMVRDVFLCERRVWHDHHSDPSARDAVSSFVELLWSEGCDHEIEVLSGLEGRVADLREIEPARRREATIAALEGEADHVLGGEMIAAGLLGRPDLISRIEGEWVAGDVKSGSPFASDGRRVKPEYGLQIALYAAVLLAAGVGPGDRAFVVGQDGRLAMFGIDDFCGAGTLRTVFEANLALARGVAAGSVQARGACSSMCGLCHWRSVCRTELQAADDVTLVADLGRRVRGQIAGVARTRTELAALDVSGLSRADGRPGVPGVGADRLRRFVARSRLQLDPSVGPYAIAPLGLARAPVEWHLDIESDPGRDGFVYLHGVWERTISASGTEEARFVHFFADEEDGEGRAFAELWAFLNSDPTAMIYHYSAFEPTSYRKLQCRHGEVCTAQAVSDLFASPRVIDLYADVVKPLTEWPLSSYGLKPIAKLNGFSWAAEDASGAASIAWYREYLASGDPAIRERIVDYNRSDCIASAVVLDALIGLPVRSLDA